MESYTYKESQLSYINSMVGGNSIFFYRFFDILFSLTAIILFSPLLLIVAIILKLTNDDDIFYRQERIGKGGRAFFVYKFTTMIKNSENMGSGTITVKNDSRVFPFGKFLRKTKINELPQLFNILKGDMSIVGPRPLPMERYQTYSDSVKQSINLVMPGLSGVGSILFRNEDEILSRVEDEDKVRFYDEIISPYKGRVETWFVANQSLYLYFMVIFMTIFIVVFPNMEVNYQKIFRGLPEEPQELKGIL
jgi:lipopolysaccharide/colanic/teichoic acid biosynthesis glycosyltransferase